MPMQWRKSPQDLIDLFSSVVPGPPVVQRKMFGYPAAFVNGNLFMSLFQDDMILRLPEGLREELLKVDGAKIFSPMPGRPMREYVAIPPRVMENKKELASCLKPKSRASKPMKAGTKPKRPVPSKKKK